MLDIAIAVTLAVIAMLTMYLGVHLTLHPVDSPIKRRLYKGPS